MDVVAWSFKLLGAGLAGLHPALIIGQNVIPFFFHKLCASGPNEVSVSILVECLEHACGEVSDLFIGEECRRFSAHTVLDGILVILSKWANSGCSAVEISANTIGKIGLRARFPFAWVLIIRSLGIIDAIEPQSAIVGSERPFTCPQGVLEILMLSNQALVLVAIVLNVVTAWVPGHVGMVIADDILHIVAWEKIVPDGGIFTE